MYIPSPSPESRFFWGFFLAGCFSGPSRGAAGKWFKMLVLPISASFHVTPGRNDPVQAVVPIRFRRCGCSTTRNRNARDQSRQAGTRRLGAAGRSMPQRHLVESLSGSGYSVLAHRRRVCRRGVTAPVAPIHPRTRAAIEPVGGARLPGRAAAEHPSACKSLDRGASASARQARGRTTVSLRPAAACTRPPASAAPGQGPVRSG